MSYDVIVLLKLMAATLSPVVLSVCLYCLERKTNYGKWNYWLRQVITGVFFAIIAMLATDYGIEVKGAVLNVRNAAPLTAGLLFGGSSGIIAGIIGGVYRWFAAYWGAGTFTRLACTLGCMLSGIFGAVCRKFMFENKKASWFYGLAIGLTTEVTHMLLIFITNMGHIGEAYAVVAVCAPPMIICTGVSVMLSLLFVSIIGREKVHKTGQNRQISQVFQFLLLICVIIAFAITSVFTYSLQTHIAYASVDELLKLNLDDVENAVQEASDDNLLRVTKAVASRITVDTSNEDLSELAEEYNVAGINIINNNGIIIKSTMPKFVWYDMASGTQSGEFMVHLKAQGCYVQSYQPIDVDNNIYRKYAGIELENGEYVQVGYDAEQFQKEVTSRIQETVKNRHIEQNGGIIVCDDNLFVVAANDAGLVGESVIAKKASQSSEPGIGERFTADIGGTNSYCIFNITEGFYLIAAIPVSEAMFSRNIAVCILMFMEVVVFAALFTRIYFLIKILIVNNIHKINDSLSKITDGNLDVYVNVRENEEFASLSDDINATVDTLKHYIEEAESRIDRELEFARQIQHSSLPSVFPPYPDHKEFDIYASMEAAKEVGGDFYDFYMIDENYLTFLVADVSGKGIPGALFMMRAKALIKNLVESKRSIDEVFTIANQKLCENNEAEMFVTAWMGQLDLTTGVLEYVNAGHNPPLIRYSNGEAEYLRTKPNFILAGMDITKYKKYELQFEKGDEIFLYTDGVTEAADKDNVLYGEERLQRIISGTDGTSKETCEALHKDIDAFVKDAEQSDDITMMCIKWEANV